MSEPVNPISDAIRSTGVPAVVDTLRGFVEKLLGDAIGELGGILADNVRSWRLANQQRILLRSKQLVEQEDRAPHNVPPRTLIPLLEAAGNEDHPDLQELWAALLANAATVTGQATPPAYVEILKQLSPFDARVLTEGFTKWGLPRSSVFTSNVFDHGWRKDAGRAAMLAATASNLERLGLISVNRIDSENLQELLKQLQRAEIVIDSRAERGSLRFDEFRLRDATSGGTSLTVLGVDFLRSCLPPIAVPIQGPDTNDLREQYAWMTTLDELRSDLAHQPSLIEALDAALVSARERTEVLRAESYERANRRRQEQLRAATKHPISIKRLSSHGTATRRGAQADRKNELIGKIEDFLRAEFGARGKPSVVFSYAEVAQAVPCSEAEVADVLKNYSDTPGSIVIWDE